MQAIASQLDRIVSERECPGPHGKPPKNFTEFEQAVWTAGYNEGFFAGIRAARDQRLDIEQELEANDPLYVPPGSAKRGQEVT